MLWQAFHQHLLYPAWTRKDRNYPFNHLAQFEQSQYQDPAERDAQRFTQLQRLLQHAYETTSFYRDHWQAEDIHYRDINNWQDFESLPFVSKADIQTHLDAMISTAYERSSLVKNQTGGSTGQPLAFYHDQARMASRLASTIRHDRWAGKDYSTYYACFWGHPAEAGRELKQAWERWKDEYISRVCFIDTSSLSLERFEQCTQTLKQKQPQVYLAYANSIYMYARYLREAGIQDYHRPRSIITSAELLEDSMRELIEEVFECNVFNRYGCREVSVIASECDHHNGLHVNEETLHVEILDANQQPVVDTAGQIVITDLFNLGMPLIRYQIKDMAIRKPQGCSCGRTLPLIAIEGGRATDFITTADGRMVSGASLTIYLVANARGVGQAQIYQPDIDNAILRIYKNQFYSDETTRYLLDTTKNFLGEAIQLSLEYLDEPIAPSASGKHRFSISEVDPFA